MNNLIDLTKPITFGQTFSYTFRFFKKNFLKMLPLLALFFIPTLIIFIVAAYPFYIRLTPLYNNSINIFFGATEMTDTQLSNFGTQYIDFLRFSMPLILLSISTMLLGFTVVLETIKIKVEKREESIKETLIKIFSNHITFYGSLLGMMLIISFITMLPPHPFLAAPFIIYTISIFCFIPQTSYFERKGMAQSFKESFLLSRKKLFFIFGFITLLSLIYSIGSLVIIMVGGSLIEKIHNLSQNAQMATSIASENILDISNAKMSAKLRVIYNGFFMLTAHFFLFPFFSIATSLQYFSLKHQFKANNINTENNINESEKEFLPENLPI